MRDIIQIWKNNFFSQLILDIILPITLFITISNRKQFSQLKFFPYYLGAFNILMLNGYIYYLLKNTEYSIFFISIDRAGNYIVSLIEFFTFSHFLYHSSKSSQSKKSIKLIGFISFFSFLFFCIPISIYSKPTAMYFLNNFYVVESVFLLAMSCFYFVDLFWFKPVFNPREAPDFWIFTGLIFYIIGTLPVTIINNYFYAADRSLYENFFCVIYLLYALLFLMIIKAYTCKPKKTAN